MNSTDAKVLAELLKANVTVQWLHAKSNSLRAGGAKAISEMLKVNKTLIMVDLSGNEIGMWSQGSHSTPNSNPYKEHFTPEGPAALAEGLKANQSVQQLDVSNNCLDQASKDALTQAKPQQLQSLDTHDSDAEEEY
jgi:hypothetical protein